MASYSSIDRKRDTPTIGGSVFPVRKMTSTSVRLPVLTIDGIDALLEEESEEMKTVLAWIDEQTFSRPKKHLHRDFADGVMMAELIHQFIPKIVELHNYIPANSLPAKKNNWKTLNRKVFSKLDFALSDTLIEFLALSKSGAVELVLKFVYGKIMSILEARARQVEAENESRTRSGDAFGGHGEGSGKDVICKVYGDNQDLLIYNGTRYLSQKLFEEKQNRVNAQDQELKELKNKVRRLETLVNLKDERLCVLTMEVHQAQQRKSSQSSDTKLGKNNNNNGNGQKR
jgi:hypothetical protein